MKYRSRNDIIQSILVSAKEIQGVTKTRIMFEAYLSFAQLKGYLSIVIENGLVEHDPETNRYRTTNKGTKMLEVYEKVNELAGEVRTL